MHEVINGEAHTDEYKQQYRYHRRDDQLKPAIAIRVWLPA